MGIAIPAKTDTLFPMIATGGYLNAALGVTFIIGVVAAAYSSADSALTALTTSFTVDILGATKYEEPKLKRIRTTVHLGMSLLLIATILFFKAINDEAVIKAIYTVAGYTYGPLLGLYAFGVFTKRRVRDYLIPVAAVLAPVICYVATRFFPVGFELLIYNGFVTFVLMWLTGIGLKSKPEKLIV